MATCWMRWKWKDEFDVGYTSEERDREGAHNVEIVHVNLNWGKAEKIMECEEEMGFMCVDGREEEVRLMQEESASGQGFCQAVNTAYAGHECCQVPMLEQDTRN